MPEPKICPIMSRPVSVYLNEDDKGMTDGFLNCIGTRCALWHPLVHRSCNECQFPAYDCGTCPMHCALLAEVMFKMGIIEGGEE